jgi:hypothetical protein
MHYFEPTPTSTRYCSQECSRADRLRQQPPSALAAGELVDPEVIT